MAPVTACARAPLCSLHVYLLVGAPRDDPDRASAEGGRERAARGAVRSPSSTRSIRLNAFVWQGASLAAFPWLATDSLVSTCFVTRADFDLWSGSSGLQLVRVQVACRWLRRP